MHLEAGRRCYPHRRFLRPTSQELPSGVQRHRSLHTEPRPLATKGALHFLQAVPARVSNFWWTGSQTTWGCHRRRPRSCLRLGQGEREVAAARSARCSRRPAQPLGFAAVSCFGVPRLSPDRSPRNPTEDPLQKALFSARSAMQSRTAESRFTAG